MSKPSDQPSDRRTFLRDGLFVSVGATAAVLLRPLFEHEAVASGQGAGSGAEKRLRELGIQLPPAPSPVAVYVPAVVSGNTLYASGHGPRAADGKLLQGRVGKDLTLKQGYDAARLTGIGMLSTVRSTLGSLDKVVRLLKVTGMVNCTPDFTRQPEVVNGFSELMVQVFGEKNGKAARSAVGMGSLPRNIPVEIEAIFEVRP